MGYPTVETPIDDLRPHPRNYRSHPADQVEHLAASITEHGFYRNVVAARDLTILAGHGIVLAARSLGLDTVPVVRLDIAPDSPQALKILAADNEVTRFAEVDDRALTELLKEINDTNPFALLGTGYDPMMLANLVMVTRPASEIANFDAATEWVGLPAIEGSTASEVKFIVTFPNVEARDQFIAETKIDEVVAITHGTPSTVSAIFPIPDETRNPSDVIYVADD